MQKIRAGKTKQKSKYDLLLENGYMTLEDFKKKLRKMTLTKSKELKLRLEYEKKILTGFSKQGVYAEKV